MKFTCTTIIFALKKLKDKGWNKYDIALQFPRILVIKKKGG